MTNLTIENVYTRQAAKALSKKHFWKLLGMMVITFGVSLGLTYGGIFLLAKATSVPVENVLSTTFSTTYVSISTQVDSSAPLSFLLGYGALMVLVSILGGGLGLGLMSALLDICRNQESVKVRQVFSRMRYCFKSFLLGLWVTFKTLLWALPGLVIIFFVVGGILVVGDPHTMQATEATTVALSFMPFVMMAVIFALVIPAALRYYLSTYILADEPATGVFDCVKQSKAMMKGHKWQCFKLTIPLLLTCYAIMFGVMIVLVVAMFVLGQTAAQSEAYGIFLLVFPAVLYTVFIGVVLVYNIRASLCCSLFYLKRKGELAAVPPEEEERIVCWQPGVEQTPGESVPNGSDDHIACWQPGEEKKDEE